MMFGIPVAMLLELGKPLFSQLLTAFKGRMDSKEFKALIVLQLNDAEEILSEIVKQLQVLIDAEAPKELSLDKKDLIIHTMQLAMVKRSIDRVGDMVRGYDDDAIPPNKG